MYTTIDTSALIAVMGNQEQKRKTSEITSGYSIYAPISVHWEIGNAFSVMFKGQKVGLDLAKQALAVYREIPIKYIEVPLEKTLEITHAQKIYACDACLLQCA